MTAPPRGNPPPPPAASLAVIATGSTNLASVLAAFRRLGVVATPTRDPEVVRTAERVVLPGVGAFGDVMTRLRERGVVEATSERVASGRPLLAICLGLQVLAQGSEESPDVPGLGALPVTVRRFPATSKVPQLGWNQIVANGGDDLVRDGYAFFANSFYLASACDGWAAAWATHDVPFVAALQRGPQLACQFHPELSGAWGASLLERWYASC
ncbi:MAG: imidazole glycerol phosphate synthase subunit HisH [Gemmatimonadota bacterium]